ncbi:MAG: LD-carboxypeptidase [Paludibacteraceae bacterium]|nr:LD-carboxypeptidase [Paludibacteraceae bacterium]
MKHIRILSPASAIDLQWINQAKVRLEQWGFCVSVAAHAYGHLGRFSATDEERLSDLNAAFADPAIDIILCSRGGYGLQRILDRIVLPNCPKEQWPLLVGFSDVTALHALLSLHGVPSLHANMCKDISLLPDDDTSLLEERKLLTLSPHSLLPFSLSPFTMPLSPLNRSGEAKGPLIGGNLSVLYGLQGTPYGLNNIINQCSEPPILFIEDICERHYHIDRMLHNLRMSGVFERISGLLVGQFTDCADDSSMGCTLMESIRQVVEPYAFPVLFDYPAGHIDSNYPLLLSAQYQLII